MTRYEQIKNFDVDNLTWFIQTIIDETEEGMLHKLAEYGIDVSIVSLEPSIRHMKIIADLLREVNDEHT